MNIFAELASVFSRWMRPSLSSISTAIIATLLVVYANDFSRWLRKRIRKHHFIVRAFIFVVVCAFGYGAVTLFLASIVARYLALLNNVLLAPVVIGVFIIIGVAAEHKNHI